MSIGESVLWSGGMTMSSGEVHRVSWEKENEGMRTPLCLTGLQHFWEPNRGRTRHPPQKSPAGPTGDTSQAGGAQIP